MHPDRWTPTQPHRERPRFPRSHPPSKPRAFANSVVDKMETEKPAPRKIPVQNAQEENPLFWAGAKRNRSGLSDPWTKAVTPDELYRGDDPVSRPTPLRDRYKMGMTMATTGPAAMLALGGGPRGAAAALRAGLEPMAFTTADVVNDINARVAEGRRHQADDPRTELDDPVYQYTSPGRDDPWRQEDKVHYYLLPGGGKPVEESELTEENYKQAVWAYTTDPYGMVILTSDGEKSEEAQQVGKKQIGSGYELNPDGTEKLDAEGRPIPKPVSRWGVAQPRAPWQDTSGDSAVEFGALGIPILPKFNPDYNIRDLPTVVREFPEWFADLNLGSAPYYVPKYRYASAAALSAPSAMGYDTGSYMPTAPGFEDLGGIGLGTYGDEPMSYTQRVAGTLEPPIAAWAERAGMKPGGQAIGGLGDIAAAKLLPKAASKWIDTKRWARTLRSGIGEGVEEILSAPLDMAQMAGLRDYGKDSYVNDVTGETVYQPTPVVDRMSNLMNLTGEYFMSGVAMGLPISTVFEGFDAFRNRYRGYQPTRDIPVRNPDAVIPADDDIDPDDDIDY